MNKLYSFLMIGHTPIQSDYEWYAKHTSEVAVTDRATAIAGIVLTDVLEAKTPLYVSVVCYAALQTQFGPEIKKLDPDNTYVAVTRPSTATHADTKYCMHDLVQTAEVYKGILKYLDDDIRDRLDTHSWTDMIGAACLQILREIA